MEYFRVGGNDLRRIERAGLHKVERAKYESDLVGSETALAPPSATK